MVCNKRIGNFARNWQSGHQWRENVICDDTFTFWLIVHPASRAYSETFNLIKRVAGFFTSTLVFNRNPDANLDTLIPIPCGRSIPVPDTNTVKKTKKKSFLRDMLRASGLVNLFCQISNEKMIFFVTAQVQPQETWKCFRCDLILISFKRLTQRFWSHFPPPPIYKG